MSDSRLDLAAHTRRLIDLLANSSDHDSPAVRRAADLVRRAVQEVEHNDGAGPAPRSSSWTANEHHHAHFRDYGPFTGRFSPMAPPIDLVQHDDHVEGTVVYGRAYEGPPRFVHGGFVAAGFDEVLGFAQALGPQPGMTGRLTVAYRSPTPLGEPVRYRARVERHDGRKTVVLATLRVVADDRLCAEAKGLFIAMHPQRRQGLWPEEAGEGGQRQPA